MRTTLTMSVLAGALVAWMAAVGPGCGPSTDEQGVASQKVESQAEPPSDRAAGEGGCPCAQDGECRHGCSHGEDGACNCPEGENGCSCKKNKNGECGCGCSQGEDGECSCAKGEGGARQPGLHRAGGCPHAHQGQAGCRHAGRGHRGCPHAAASQP